MTFKEHDFDDVTDTLNVVAISTLSLLCIMSSISLAYGVRFWFFRRYQVLKKRYSLIACVEILFVLLGFVINGCVILSVVLQSVWLRQISFHIRILIQYLIIYCWLWRYSLFIAFILSILLLIYFPSI